LATHEVDYSLPTQHTHICHSAQQNKAAYQQQEQLTTSTSPENVYNEVTRIIIESDECHYQKNFVV